LHPGAGRRPTRTPLRLNLPEKPLHSLIVHLGANQPIPSLIVGDELVLVAAVELAAEIPVEDPPSTLGAVQDLVADLTAGADPDAIATVPGFAFLEHLAGSRVKPSEPGSFTGLAVGFIDV